MLGKVSMIHLVAEPGPNKDSLQELLDFIKKIAKQVDVNMSPDNIVKFKFEPLDDPGLTEEQIKDRIEQKCSEYDTSPIMAVSIS